MIRWRPCHEITLPRHNVTNLQLRFALNGAMCEGLSLHVVDGFPFQVFVTVQFDRALRSIFVSVKDCRC